MLFFCALIHYDVAFQEQKLGTTNAISGDCPWELRFAPGNFTFLSHMTMFAGFMPTSVGPKEYEKKIVYFFKKCRIQKASQRYVYLKEELLFKDLKKLVIT